MSANASDVGTVADASGLTLSDQPAVVTPGSLRSLMDAVVVLENSINDEIDSYNATYSMAMEHLRVYRWRPRSIEAPAVYNWIPTLAPFEQRDLARWRDVVTLTTRVAVEMSDNDEDMAQVEFYADVFRKVVDGALDRNRPLSGASFSSMRTGMRLVSDTFNQIDYLCAEFFIESWLDRRVH